ncbi:hypothetical protein WR25_26781 [Diploscapter pachys]|uniref:Glycosyltransferase family 92 protein n=1 Tax=Diploscapter pachys TaxID=2018661 RepID=A0A2A2KSU5_9BILA|nr:hypothetical protein WR25_26781 [Diploscapter pachys]
MMHLYIRSVVSPLYELLRIYDLQGYAKIIPWPRLGMKFVPEADFNPNLNVEFRNQAAAQTDCLLQNKESVEFISFVDLDDILLPRADSYFDEFNQLFLSMPEIAYAHYIKLNAHVNAASRGSEFDLREMFTSVRFEGKTETGKLVAKPNYINSTWIHWPSAVPKQMIGFK